MRATPIEDQPGFWSVRINLNNRPEECHSIGSQALAVVNSTEIPILGRGGTHLGGPLGISTECHGIWAEGAVPAAEDHSLRIRVFDGSQMIVTALVLNATAERSVSWVQPADGLLRPGATAVLAWSPSTDHVTFRSSSSHLMIDVDEGAEFAPPFHDGPVEVDGHLLKLRVSEWQRVRDEPSQGTLTLHPENVSLLVEEVFGLYSTVVAEGLWAPSIRYAYGP